jgi:galactitol-specific phosphotransferase system IIC component
LIFEILYSFATLKREHRKTILNTIIYGNVLMVTFFYYATFIDTYHLEVRTLIGIILLLGNIWECQSTKHLY